jgi:hypothetical protein
MSDYVLKGWDDQGNVCVEFELDAADDEDAAERAQSELASGGYDHCFSLRLYRLDFVLEFVEPSQIGDLG